jgi:hypothetical protein
MKSPEKKQAITDVQSQIVSILHGIVEYGAVLETDMTDLELQNKLDSLGDLAGSLEKTIKDLSKVI